MERLPDGWRKRDTDRFVDKFETHFGEGCWLWTDSLNKGGYGQFHFRSWSGKRRNLLAHVVAWYLSGGLVVPAGWELDHLCRVRHCVRPSHLEPVTKAENIRRGRWSEGAARKRLAQTHCKRGHPLSGENLYIGSRGDRVCRTCRRDRKRGTYANLGEAGLLSLLREEKK